MRNTTQKYIYGISAILLLCLLLPDTIIAQTPQTFNYQAVLRGGDKKVRDTDDAVVQIAIHQGSESGTEVYSELHSITTNAFGLINLEIGSKNPANFSLIDWSNGPFYLKVFVDGNEMGTSQLLSVPFAMYAANGAQGEKGEQGDPGPQGGKGDPGPKGEPGDTEWNEASGGISYMNGNVGIGTDNPEFKLQIKGPVKIEGNDLVLGEPTRGDGGRALVHFGDGTGLDDILILNFEGDFEEGVYVQGNKLLIDGDLGIGTTTPSEKLDVEGSIQVDGSYKYETAKTRYYSVSHAAFDLETDGNSYEQRVGDNDDPEVKRVQVGGGELNNEARLVAPVYLPDGARITQVNALVFDNLSTYNVKIRLVRQDIIAANHGNQISIAFAATSGTPNMINLIDNSITFPVVDNQNYSYNLQFDTSENTSYLALYNVRITYTITEVD